MLTLILLVVLGGGVGILAVSMAERKPATNAPDSRRARDRSEGAPTATATPPPVEQQPDRPQPQPEPQPAPQPQPVPQPAPSPPARGRSAGPERRLHRGDVPRSQTAVEGELGDLLRPSLPRRLTSLVGVVLLVVGVGVGIAAFLGAIVGGVAELFGNAIG